MDMLLELPKHLKILQYLAHHLATGLLRPISRKYDLAEHTYPKELDSVAAILDGMNAGQNQHIGASNSHKSKKHQTGMISNGNNMSSVIGIQELSWGDTGLLLSLPRQGLGNAAISAIANDEQLKRLNGKWAAMAITEASTGSDSAAIRTTAKKDGDHYIINGEKTYITSGQRADIIVVWATLDKNLGRAAIKPFAIDRNNPGVELLRVENKLGIKASDTATIAFTDCRVHESNLLGDTDMTSENGYSGIMETFDNTRPLVASMAVGLAKSSLDQTRYLLKNNIQINYTTAINSVTSAEAELYKMEAEWEAARLLTLKAAWMADNNMPNSMEASIAKAKAGRVCNYITLKCVELCSGVGYSESELLEKWARDSKILDIFEGTQQIQQLIIARKLLGKKSSQLK